MSPNVIHSMDACHLQMTVLNAVDNHRIRDFFLIHDSFGVMPADCPRMFNAVRQSFVELYRDNCLYTMLANQVRDYIDDPDSVSFPEIPAKGDLVLEDVLRSQYCFLNQPRKKRRTPCTCESGCWGWPGCTSCG